MSPRWQDELQTCLAAANKVAILGIGSELKSDDKAGMQLIAELNQAGLDNRRVLLLAGSTAPENFTGVIKDFTPDILLAIDAARLGLAPGSIALLPPEDLDGLGFSTHMLPFSVVLRYLQKDRDIQVLLLGIQPQSTEFGLELSPPVAGAIQEVKDFLLKNLT